MAGYKIRALTLLSRIERVSSLTDAIENLLSRLSEARDQASSEVNLEIETIRLVAEGIGLDVWNNERLQVAEIAEDYKALISIGALDLETAWRNKDILRGLLEAGLFFNILLPDRNWKAARVASKFIHEIAEVEPSLATMFGVNVYGKPIGTPYYPLASSSGDVRGLTVSLTYPNYLAEAYSRGGIEALYNAVLEAAKVAEMAGKVAAETGGFTYAGVDLSVAPWMRESSLGLVELVAGVRAPEPGFLMGIRRVNRVLDIAARKIGAIGFNEVQLPVAEDLKMKARMSELDTTARDLARFTCVCLAGLDLAVVPADVEGVAGLLLDTGACSEVKDRVLGVRIIPVEDVEPGDKVWLDKFGETPVIPL